ncbi:hypothetical protein KW830_08375 [Comamonas sp. CMM03]|uniref:hypothetical protein n=1 Tax=Comamonas TaxID=283 RepID=UPI001C454BFB|nr:hypothetical protein [Comamonas terrigena]MBV7418471.1 hypothetical protein [Comamonas sp. CMM03]
MKETGLMFKAPLVRAILAGQKTQTRRILKLRPGFDFEQRDDGRWWPWAEHPDRADDVWQPAPCGDIGDRIYVRETFSHFVRNENFKDGCECFYRADGDCVDLRPWRPAIHMPKWAARIWLENTGVRAERLQSITEADCIAEGATGGHGAIPGYAYSATPLEHFRHIWETTGGNWAANPWVWVNEFKTISTTGRPA